MFDAALPVFYLLILIKTGVCCEIYERHSPYLYKLGIKTESTIRAILYKQLKL